MDTEYGRDVRRSSTVMTAFSSSSLLSVTTTADTSDAVEMMEIYESRTLPFVPARLGAREVVEMDIIVASESR